MIDVGVRLKHAFVRGVFRSLMKDGGYRVISGGMEDIAREVTLLDDAEFKALELAMPPRVMPDFIVFNGPMTESHLVEVKYRSTLDARLIFNLEFRLKHYPRITFAMMYSNGTNQGAPQHHFEVLRACRLVQQGGAGYALLSHQGATPVEIRLDQLTADRLWDGMLPIQSIFSGIKLPNRQITDALATMAKQIAA